MRRTDEYWNEVRSVALGIPSSEAIKGKTVLITGATGLIGSAICDVLFCLNSFENYGMDLIIAGRDSKRAADRFPDQSEGKDYKFMAFDSKDAKGIDDVVFDYAIYGAGYGDPKAITADPTGVIASNVTGLDSVLKQASANKARVLFISSSEVYGRLNVEGSYREDEYGYVDILNPRASYPCAKRLGENLCVSYAEQFGIETVIARPGHIYGPHITAADSRASAEFSRKAFRGEPIVMKSAGLQMRSYTYSLDCASAVITMMINGNDREAYNISNPEAVVTIRRLAEELAAAGNVELINEIPTEAESRSYNLMSRSDLNGEKLLALGWKPQYDITQGAAATLKYL